MKVFTTIKTEENPPNSCGGYKPSRPTFIIGPQLNGTTADSKSVSGTDPAGLGSNPRGLGYRGLPSRWRY